ncbi:hypothetical protein BJ170DRAFT_683983 [Xylariales sp. AK1849]|nr:hypothetical protein BJ170DRAFT_683983 [Xylariales sp. AK1849]
MLPSSVRRVVTVAPQSALLSNFAPTAARATAAAAVSFPYNSRNQQRRRYSSSKPSSPNDSPKSLPAGQMTASPTQSSKSTGEKRRRKAKDNTADAIGKPTFPSVPSTAHVPLESLALSTFFSQHRPMSVTQGFPRAVTDDAFARIFAPRSKAGKYSDVVSALSRTVDELEQPMQDLTISGQDEAATLDADDQLHRIEVRNSDGSESSMYVQLNAMSGQFLPFRPPPLPQPELAVTSTKTGAKEAVETTPQYRVYKAIFTLEETTEPNGEVRIVAHSPTLIDKDSTPRTFLERKAVRQLRRQEADGRPNEMIAISVKRQRKLKMKKKKYKKLMKRTRNERRKLDRV